MKSINYFFPTSNWDWDAYHVFQPPMENGVLKGNAFADKLDGLMVIVCEHLKSRAENGHLLKVNFYIKHLLFLKILHRPREIPNILLGFIFNVYV